MRAEGGKKHPRVRLGAVTFIGVVGVGRQVAIDVLLLHFTFSKYT